MQLLTTENQRLKVYMVSVRLDKLVKQKFIVYC